MARIKRAICLLAVFVITTGALVGCALFERDADYYNNMIVATIGADIRITKGQLIQAYNSFGYQYVTQQQLSVKEAYDNTLDELINREIIVELSIRNFSFNDMTDSAKALYIKQLRGKKGVESLFYNALYENEKAEVRKQAFDSVNEYFVQLQDKVREERKIAFNTKEGEEDPNTATPVVAQDPFKSFEPQVIRSENNTVYNMDISAYVNRELFTAPDKWSPDISESDEYNVKLVKTESLARLVRVLSNNERGMQVGKKEANMVEEQKYLTEKEKAVIGRELGRMIEDNSKSLLIRRYQENFDLGITTPIDRSQFERAEGYKLAIQAAILGIADIPVRSAFDSASAHEAAIRELIRTVAGGHTVDCADDSCAGCSTFINTQIGRANNLAEQARNFYRGQVLSQYSRYVKKIDTDEALASKVLEGLSDTYWLPKDIAESHYTVSHILIQYTDAQKAELEDIKSEFAAGGYVNVNNYNEKIQALQGKLSARARDEKGVEYGNAVPATTILQEIKDALDGVDAKVKQLDGTLKDSIWAPNYGNKNETERRAEEAKRINVFRDFIYKYNQDPGMNNAEYEYVMSVGGSKMVAEFTDASRELFGYYKKAREVGGKPVFDSEGKPVYDWMGNDSVPGLHLASCDSFRKDAGRPVYDNNGVFIEYNKLKCDGCKNGFVAQRSSMTAELVMTEFGAHIIMYTRPLSDFIYNTTVNRNFISFESFESDLDLMLADLTVKNFLFAPLTSYGDTFGLAKTKIDAPAKTIFDVAVEKATKPAFENKRNGLITNFKNERKNGKEDGKLINKITIHRGNFKDLIR